MLYYAEYHIQYDFQITSESTQHVIDFIVQMFHIVVSYCLKTPAFNYTPGCHVAVGIQSCPTPNLTIVSALDTFTLPSNLKFYTDTEVKGLALPTSTDNTT